MNDSKSTYWRANIGWIAVFVAVSGAALVRLIVATVNDPSLLWNALLVIPIAVVGMWLLGYATSTSARQRQRFLTGREPEAIHIHASHLDQSLLTLSRLGLAELEVRKRPLDLASLLFTNDSLEIWTGGKSPRLFVRLPRSDFRRMTHERTIVTAVNPAVSVTLSYESGGRSSELTFVPTYAIGRPIRPRSVGELLSLIRIWIGSDKEV